MKYAAAWLLALLVVVQAGVFAANSSGTIDETSYWHMAQAALQQGDTTEFAIRGVAPLPILLAYALPVINNVGEYASAILLARGATVLLVSVPLVLVVYFWMAREIGVAAAALAAALVALSPSIVAHGAVATTDACFVLCALLSLWALTRYLERPTWTRLATVAAAGGLAFAAKYSGAMFSGIAAIVCLWMDRPARPIGLRLLSAAAIAAAMIAAGIAFTWNYQPIEGLRSQLFHQRAGHEAFLLGRRSMDGWWYYQPFALAVKSTYVELAAFVLAAAAFIAGRRTMVLRVWGVAFAAVLLFAMTSHVAIGVRYVLLLFPLAIMAATAWVVDASARPWAAALGVIALIVQAATAVAASPRQLSYFNGLAGGPLNGYRLLADSNLDWGQDLPAIGQVMASVGAREPLAAYFGSAPPEAYGVHVWQWDLTGPQQKLRADWIVISATYLDGLYLSNDPFEAFRSIEADARPTPSLFLYDAARPAVKAALARAMERKP